MTETRMARMDVDILERIESALALDCVPPPGVIMPLMERTETQERSWWTRPEPDDSLEDDIEKALDGEWLHLEEIAAIQRLRGWNRSRYGHIQVRVSDLLEAVRVLEILASGLEGECDGMLRELDYPGVEVIRAQVEARLARDGTCGECQWCQICDLACECNRALDASGVERGVEYRVCCLGQSVEQANYEVYGVRVNGYDPQRAAS